MSHDLQLRAALLCDAVYDLQGGKQQLTGIYGDYCAVRTLPATLVLTLWVRIHSPVSGRCSFLCAVRGPGDEGESEQLTAVETEWSLPEGANHLAFAGLVLPVRRAGLLTFHLRWDNYSHEVARLLVCEQGRPNG
jgi:hypothetical protein